MINQYVSQALRRWEPRIEVMSVTVLGHTELDGALIVDVNYLIKATHDRRSIVYPFFLEGEEEW